MTSECTHPVEAVLQYTFRDRTWLESALRHRSAAVHDPTRSAHQPHNERLEFLGDAVLDLAIRDALFHRYAHASEGQLTQYRSRLASRATLATVARRIGLEPFLQADLRDTGDHPSQDARLLADAVEAVLGAVYSDGGYAEAHRVAARLFAPELEQLDGDPHEGNYKSALQEFWQRETGRPPSYQIVRRHGPSHAPAYEMAAVLGPTRGESGAGWSKREAAQNAAQATLERLMADDEWRTETLRRAEAASRQRSADAPRASGPRTASGAAAQHTAYIGLGSNVGDRLDHLRRALSHLDRPDCVIVGVSSVYETAPVGIADQPWFLNVVAQLSTELCPGELFELLKDTEVHVGRRPSERWGPREIDLDLLLIDDVVIKAPTLTVPHPRLHERSFVLIPLSELAADLVHPSVGSAIATLRDDLQDPSEVRRRHPPEELWSAERQPDAG